MKVRRGKMPPNPDQVRMARAAIDMPMAELAKRVRVGVMTISRLENWQPVVKQAETTSKIAGVLAPYVLFIDQKKEHGVGVLLKTGMGHQCWKQDVSEGGPETDSAAVPGSSARAKVRAYVEQAPDTLRTLPDEVRSALMELVEIAEGEIAPISNGVLPAAE